MESHAHLEESIIVDDEIARNRLSAHHLLDRSQPLETEYSQVDHPITLEPTISFDEELDAAYEELMRQVDHPVTLESTISLCEESGFGWKEIVALGNTIMRSIENSTYTTWEPDPNRHGI